MTIVGQETIEMQILIDLSKTIEITVINEVSKTTYIDNHRRINNNRAIKMIWFILLITQLALCLKNT